MMKQGVYKARRRVWKQQDDSCFDLVAIEADGTAVVTYREKKQVSD
ncbi:hypothetical protein [Rhodopirellula europaea]|uniref:Uncharacterized protein n=1 Tax=Rhodopirellula europaea SH398 TaxID=1263868 RepID=M5SQC6_9BACT|nr:hypothetical protein [Rhodopirellula europaea]EMI28454.1 hypothetical protein RESH_00929 [Rhodopirellula europaea SH398]